MLSNFEINLSYLSVYQHMFVVSGSVELFAHPSPSSSTL